MHRKELHEEFSPPLGCFVPVASVKSVQFGLQPVRIHIDSYIFTFGYLADAFIQSEENSKDLNSDIRFIFMKCEC